MPVEVVKAPARVVPRAPGEIFFDGFVSPGEQSAAALTALGRLAGTRFWTPPGMVAARIAAADPVVTSTGDRLRIESFSQCGGVAGRWDLLPDALDPRPTAGGTTNVDIGPELHAALSVVRGVEPLHLRVADSLTVTTLDAAVTQARVPLPERWVRGFAEAQASARVLLPRWSLERAGLRAFVRELPPSTSGSAVLYAVPSRGGARLVARAASGPAGEPVPVGGAHRLRPLQPLARFATRLTAYGPAGEGPGPSAWCLDLDRARFWLFLSPDAMRGFSGEGGLLFDLADDRARTDAALLAVLLAWEPVLDLDRLTRESGLSPERVAAALVHIAAMGRVGYDPAESGWFHRELPYDPEILQRRHPRLRDARALVAGAAVAASGEGVWRVRSGESEHVVRGSGRDWRCTCPWFAQHGGSRGPCKHVLAVYLASRQRHSD